MAIYVKTPDIQEMVVIIDNYSEKVQEANLSPTIRYTTTQCEWYLDDNEEVSGWHTSPLRTFKEGKREKRRQGWNF